MKMKIYPRSVIEKLLKIKGVLTVLSWGGRTGFSGPVGILIEKKNVDKVKFKIAKIMGDISYKIIKV